MFHSNFQESATGWNFKMTALRKRMHLFNLLSLVSFYTPWKDQNGLGLCQCWKSLDLCKHFVGNNAPKSVAMELFFVKFKNISRWKHSWGSRCFSVTLQALASRYNSKTIFCETSYWIVQICRTASGEFVSAGIYLFKVKTTEPHHWNRSGVFIVNFDQISVVSTLKT